MHDEGLLERCRDSLAVLLPGATHDKNVFGMRGLMRGRQMFAAVGETSIIVKLKREEFEHAITQAGIKPFMPGGQKLGTWVEIQDDVVADDAELREWLAAGLRAL
jgi:hypothetical protein